MDRRSLLRWMLFGLTAPSFADVISDSANAQGTVPTGQQNRLPRPKNNPVLQVPQVSPELAKILKEWENASAGIERLQGKHTRIVYDKVFYVDRRSTGVFYYEAPGKGRIDIEAAKIPTGMKSPRKDPTGKPYKLESDHPQKWISTGQKIISINDNEKTFEVFPIPADMQGKNIINGPLPFLFGMPAALAVKRFQLKLLKNTETQVWLAAQPNWKQDAANYREAKIILSKLTYLPSAVQLIDPSGNSETVYIFSDLKANKRDLISIFGRDPFAPKLPRGYTQVTRPVEKTVKENTPGRTSLRSPSSKKIR